jgi:hypothetical protein
VRERGRAAYAKFTVESRGMFEPFPSVLRQQVATLLRGYYTTNYTTTSHAKFMLMSPAEMCARHSFRFFSRSLPDYSSTYYGTLQKTVILLYSHPSSTPVPTQHRRPSPPAVAPRDFGAPYTILNTVILLHEHPLPHSRTPLPPAQILRVILENRHQPGEASLLYH